MDDTYAEVGVEVILGEHVPRSRGANWNPGQELYVGRKTKITRVCGTDYSGCLCCYVECDFGHNDWRVENMILASDVPLLTPEDRVRRKIRDG